MTDRCCEAMTKALDDGYVREGWHFVSREERKWLGYHIQSPERGPIFRINLCPWCGANVTAGPQSDDRLVRLANLRKAIADLKQLLGPDGGYTVVRKPSVEPRGFAAGIAIDYTLDRLFHELENK